MYNSVSNSFADALSAAETVLSFPKKVLDTLHRSCREHCKNIVAVSVVFRHMASAYKNYCLAFYYSRCRHDIPSTLKLMDKIVEDLMQIAEMGILPENTELQLIFAAAKIRHFRALSAKRFLR